MAKNNNKSNLKKDFKSGNLDPKLLGTLIEMAFQYRGYYIKRKAHWAGPWRDDLMAASADAIPYAQEGYETGIRQRVN